MEDMSYTEFTTELRWVRPSPGKPLCHMQTEWKKGLYDWSTCVIAEFFDQVPL